jgi:hypothetical protein
MTDFPVPLDDLISHVKVLRPDGGPLDRLSGAVTVADRLGEHADALVGYFVDQARRSGASWSQIGASMGVSKQAAQQRFVARDDDLVPETKLFARFTPRARNAVAAAGRMAASAQADSVDVAHIAAGLLAEPEGLAAKTIHRLGVTDEQVYGVLGVGPVTGSYDSDPVALRELEFSDASKAAFRGTLKSALRLGHNYIGTEHLLLGVLSLENDTTERMTGLGLSAGLVDQALAIELASFRLDRERGTA